MSRADLVSVYFSRFKIGFYLILCLYYDIYFTIFKCFFFVLCYMKGAITIGLNQCRASKGHTNRQAERKEEIPRQQLQQVQQMHREDLLPETASSYERERRAGK